MNTLNLATEVVIDTPPLTVPWGISEEECKQLFASHGLEEDNRGGFTSLGLPSVQYLGVSDLGVVFRFDLTPGRLETIEFQYGGEKFQDKLNEMTDALQKTFGKGTEMDESKGFSGLTWTVDGVEVCAYILASAWGEVAMLTLKNKK